jgi:formylglycine-generating enzyme required for sulfatase activity
MVAVPAGWFEMGSSNPDEPDQKLHKVYVSAFSMDKYPVTQEVYGKLMGKNPSLWQGPRHPVERVAPVSLRSAKRRHPCQISVVRCGRASETVGERKLVSQPQPAAAMVC